MTGSDEDEALDLGDIEPGIPAGHPRPKPGAHPWAPSEFDRRASEVRTADAEEA